MHRRVVRAHRADSGCTWWSIKKFARTDRRYDTVLIRAGTSYHPDESIPDDPRDTLTLVIELGGAH
jgi:hypothetical protein